MIITKAAVAAATAADGDGLLLISFMSDFFLAKMALFHVVAVSIIEAE